MSAFDFQRLGTDRNSQNIKRAITNPTGTLTTGDLSAGTRTTLTFDAETSQTTTVAARRTGALMLDVQLDGMSEIHWTIADTVLTVTMNTARSGTISFWVF